MGRILSRRKPTGENVMGSQMSEAAEHEEAGVIPRALAWTVGLICAHPWLVLCLTLASCAVCGIYTWTNLTYLTHRNDLISNKKEYLKRWHQYVEEFGDDDDMVVVIRGDDRKKMENAIEAVATAINARPESFNRLFYKADLTSLQPRSLLFLPTDQIRNIQGHIQGMSLLLEPPVLAQFDPLIAWKNLGVRELLRDCERRLKSWNSAQPQKDAEDYFRQLDSISHSASDFLASSSQGQAVQYRSPWSSMAPDQESAGQGDRLCVPQYFFSADGKLAFLLASPVKDKDP